MVEIIKAVLPLISDSTLLILTMVIGILFYLLHLKDKTIEKLAKEIKENTRILERLSTLIEIGLKH